MGNMECMQDHTANAVKDIFKGIKNLQKGHPKRKFTIDGRLVGDIGEAIAEDVYDIELTTNQKAVYDAVLRLDKTQKIQIKATFKESLTFKNAYKDILYLGFCLKENGEYEEVYNGSGRTIYNALKKKDRQDFKRGDLVSIPVKMLRELSAQETQRIPKRTKK